MNILMGLMGLFVVLSGFSGILLPEKLKDFGVNRLAKLNWIFLGVIAVISGIIIIIASFSGVFNVLVRIIGVLVVIKGVVVVFVKPEKRQILINWISNLSAGKIRFISVVKLLLGVVLIFSRF